MQTLALLIVVIAPTTEPVRPQFDPVAFRAALREDLRKGREAFEAIYGDVAPSAQP